MDHWLKDPVLSLLWCKFALTWELPHATGTVKKNVKDDYLGDEIMKYIGFFKLLFFSLKIH